MNTAQFFEIIFNPAFVWIANYLLILLIIVYSIAVFKARKVFFPYLSALLSRTRILKGEISDYGRIDFKPMNLRQDILFDSESKPMQEFKELITYTFKKGRDIKKTENGEEAKELKRDGYKLIDAQITKKGLGYFIGGMPIKLYLTDKDGFLPLDDNFKPAPLSVTFFQELMAKKERMDKDLKDIFKKGVLSVDKGQIIAILSALIILAVIVYAIVGAFA